MHGREKGQAGDSCAPVGPTPASQAKHLHTGTPSFMKMTPCAVLKPAGAGLDLLPMCVKALNRINNRNQGLCDAPAQTQCPYQHQFLCRYRNTAKKACSGSTKHGEYLHTPHLEPTFSK